MPASIFSRLFEAAPGDGKTSTDLLPANHASRRPGFDIIATVPGDLMGTADLRFSTVEAVVQNLLIGEFTHKKARQSMQDTARANLNASWTCSGAVRLRLRQSGRVKSRILDVLT